MGDPRDSTLRPAHSLDPALELQAEKRAALARLAAGMAHDFNNLLMVILGNAELGLLTVEADSSAKPALEQIFAAAQRAADYCKQMSAYAGGLKLALQPTDLAALIDELRPSLANAVPQSAELRFEWADGLPAIDAEPAQLKRLIELLVANAAEALPPAGGIVTIRVTAATPGPRELAGCVLGAELTEGTFVVLEVSDTGAGMDAATAARVFDPFFTTKNKGRGLGLAFVLGILRGHRGAIRIDSQSGQGTRVRVLFPPSASAANVIGSQAAILFGWRGSGQALVIDADEAARTVAAALLEHFGFDSLVAADVPEALEILSGQAGRVNAILMAVDLPDAERELAIGKLRRVAPAATILLAGAEAKELTTANSHGADGFVVKPYAAGQLGAQLRASLG